MTGVSRLKDIEDFPDAVMFTQIRGVYDGWCYVELKDGTFVNRFPKGDYRYQATQDDIDYRISKQTEKDIDGMLSQMQGGNIQCSIK